MADTVFSKIIAGEASADIVYEDDAAVAFKDINPVAPVHLLVVPKKPIVSIAHADDDDVELLGHLLRVCRDLAAAAGLSDGGYRVVANSGSRGGQTVDHLHFHVLGGRQMSWPPG